MDNSIRILERAFDILELLVQADAPMNTAEISQKLNISEFNINRILNTMNLRHYVNRDKDNSCIAGSKIVELASRLRNSFELQSQTYPILTKLHENLLLPAHLGILDGKDVFYTDKMDLYTTTKLYTQVGYRSPAYCSSMGKCILSCLSEEDLKNIVREFDFKKYTEFTITNVTEFREYLRKVKEQGWAMDNQEYVLDHRCVGAPIFDCHGTAIASICVSGSLSQITDEHLDCIVSEVKKAALQISYKMGYID